MWLDGVSILGYFALIIMEGTYKYGYMYRGKLNHVHEGHPSTLEVAEFGTQ